MLHSIEIKKLFAFCTVCETLSFTEAAKSLNIGQSQLAIIYQLWKKNLALTFLKRTSSLVELTSEGQKVYLYAKKIFDAFRNFENYIAIKDKEPVGKLSIYGGENSLLSLLVESIDKFKSKYPKIDFDIVGGTHTLIFLPRH